MSRKESKSYVINFIDPRITAREMKMHIHISYKEDK